MVSQGHVGRFDTHYFACGSPKAVQHGKILGARESYQLQSQYTAHVSPIAHHGDESVVRFVSVRGIQVEAVVVQFLLHQLGNVYFDHLHSIDPPWHFSSILPIRESLPYVMPIYTYYAKRGRDQSPEETSQNSHSIHFNSFYSKRCLIMRNDELALITYGWETEVHARLRLL